MGPMEKRRLERFESMAQRLMEKSLSRLLGGQLDPVEISAELVRAVELNQHDGIAPQIFEVQLHPTDYANISKRWPDLADVLVSQVGKIVSEYNLVLLGTPQITLKANPEVQRHFTQVVVKADQQIEQTVSFTPLSSEDPLFALRGLDAFLIVDGERHIALDKPQMTIGRHTDCDIVVEGNYVSRRHAQLRWRYGRFIIYDLGSRVGTKVNGTPINEFALLPGDLIEINNTSFIYGEGLATKNVRPKNDDGQETRPLPNADRT